jgi:hypothetical protein
MPVNFVLRSKFFASKRSFTVAAVGCFAMANILSLGFLFEQSKTLCISRNPSEFSKYSSANVVVAFALSR